MCTRRYIHMHTQTTAPREQQQAAAFYPPPPLFSSGISASRRFSFSPPPGDGSFYCARAPGNRNPMAVGYIGRVGYHILFFSNFNLATFWRSEQLFRSEQFVQGRDRWRQNQLQTRRARALLARESGRDGPKSQVGRMDRVDAHFLHLEKSDSSVKRRSGKEMNEKRNERKKRAHIPSERDILTS